MGQINDNWGEGDHQLRKSDKGFDNSGLAEFLLL